MNPKEQKFDQVAVALAALLIKFGHLKVTHSQVAKKANVSRPWIYKYIGKDRDDLIRFALEHVGRQVTERDRDEKPSNKEELIHHVTRGVSRMLDNTETYPWLIPVYYKYRGTESAPGRVIDAVEKEYVKRQAQNIVHIFPAYDEKLASLAAEMLTSFRMGIAFQWQRGDLKKKASKDSLLTLVETWFREVLTA